MKKSFLKRAMAAAIAVPVALTQTLICTTGFAADDAAAAGAITLTADKLMAVEADTAKNVPVLAEDTGTSRAYVQESTWNQVVFGALASVANSENSTIELDTAALANAIGGDAWYADALKDALVNGGSAKAEVSTRDVLVTIGINYDYAAVAEEFLTNKIGTAVDLDVAPITGEIMVLADTAGLASGTEVSFEAVATMDDQSISADTAISYARKKLAEVKAAAEAAVAADAAAVAEVAALFEGYEAKLDAAEAKLAKAMTISKTKSYTADSYDAVLAAVKEEYAGNALVNKVPDSIEAALTNNTVSAVFAEALAQINASMTEYKLDLTPASVAEVVSGMYGVVVYGAVDSGNVTGVTAAMADDDITDAEYEALFNYFVELEGPEVAIVNFETVKVIDASVNASAAFMSGDATLDIKRAITYDVVPVEETTTETTETTDTTDTTDSTEETTDTTDSTEETEDTTDTTVDTDESTTDTTDTTVDTDESTTDTADTTVDTDESTTDTTDTTVDTDESTTDTTDTTVDTDESTTDTTDTTVDTDESTTETTDETTEVITIVASAKTANFYFSHDTTVLTGDMLLDSAMMTVTVDGVEGAPVDITDNIAFGYTSSEPDAGLTPAMIYSDWGEPYAALPVYAFYVDPDDADAEPMLIDVDIKIYVGVKGDATLDGIADAKDAANILIYAAAVGAGNMDAVLYTAEYADVENFAFFLADVTSELTEKEPLELNASDAAKVLEYAAWYGGLNTAPTAVMIDAKWEELVGEIA